MHPLIEADAHVEAAPEIPVEPSKVPIVGDVGVVGRVSTSEEPADYGTYRTIVLGGTEDKQQILPYDEHRVRAYIYMTDPNVAQAASTTTVATSNHVSNPSAGAEVTVTVPAGETWALQSVDLTLTTSATAGNRQVQLIVDDGTNELYRYLVTVTQAASLAYIYVFSGMTNDAAVRAGTGVNEVLSELPALTLAAGYRVRTSTIGIQVGDQYSAITLGYLKSTTSSTTASAVWIGSEGQCAAVKAGNTSGGGFQLLTGMSVPVQHKQPVWLVPDGSHAATVMVVQERMQR